MVAPITSSLLRGKAAGNVLIDASASGLKRDSVVLVCQVVTLSEEFLCECVATLPRRANGASSMLAVDSRSIFVEREALSARGFRENLRTAEEAPAWRDKSE